MKKVCMISPLGYTGIAYYDHCLCQSLAEIGIRLHRKINTEDPVYYPVNAVYRLRYRCRRGMSPWNGKSRRTARRS